MIALATPFGTYVKEGAKSTLTGLFESSENALNTGLNEAGVTLNKAEFGGVPTIGANSNNSSAPAFGDGKLEYGVNDPDVCHNNVIPEGGVYKSVKSKTYRCIACGEEVCSNECGAPRQTVIQYETYVAGDNFPETQQGDEYSFGGFIYKYKYACDTLNNYWLDGTNSMGDVTEAPSWFVRVNSATPSVILESLNGIQITSIKEAFAWSSVVTAPIIPNTITDISHAFVMCPQLTGDIIINTNPTTYDDCFTLFEYVGECPDITLKGSSTLLQQIANTSTEGLRTVYDANGNILMQ